VSKSRLQKFLPVLALAALALAIYLVWQSVRGYSLAEILDSVEKISWHRLAAAGGFAVASYVALTGFDWLAVRYAGQRLPYRRVALASFVSLSLGHSIGLAPLGSGAIRLRYYSGWGLSAEEIAKVVLFCTVTVTLGQVGFAGIVLLVNPEPAAAWLHLGNMPVRGIGILCLLFDAVYLVLAAKLRHPLKIRSWSFQLPSLRLALWQVAIGTINFALLAAALDQLLADATAAAFWSVATTFVLANVAALISHVPGGLGVIEWVVLSLFPEPGAFAAILVYRALYYLLPLGVGGIIFGATAFRRRRAERRVARSGEAAAA
jgi:hypothetical protein